MGYYWRGYVKVTFLKVLNVFEWLVCISNSFGAKPSTHGRMYVFLMVLKKIKVSALLLCVWPFEEFHVHGLYKRQSMEGSKWSTTRYKRYIMWIRTIPTSQIGIYCNINESFGSTHYDVYTRPLVKVLNWKTL